MARKSPEVIDLTETHPPEVIVIDSDDDDVKPFSVPLIHTVVPQETDSTNTPKKKFKFKHPKAGESVAKSAHSSRDRPWKEEDIEPAQGISQLHWHGTVSQSPNGKHAMETKDLGETTRARKRRRDHHSPEQGLRERRLSHSPARRDHTDLPRPPDVGSDLFFIDVIPAQLPTSPQHPTPVEREEGAKLLLPAHVSILEGEGGKGTLVKIQMPAEPEGGDYIEYLDYDDLKVDSSFFLTLNYLQINLLE
jgi:hypothetical protein